MSEVITTYTRFTEAFDIVGYDGAIALQMFNMYTHMCKVPDPKNPRQGAVQTAVIKRMVHNLKTLHALPEDTKVIMDDWLLKTVKAILPKTIPEWYSRTDENYLLINSHRTTYPLAMLKTSGLEVMRHSFRHITSIPMNYWFIPDPNLRNMEEFDREWYDLDALLPGNYLFDSRDLKVKIVDAIVRDNIQRVNRASFDHMDNGIVVDRYTRPVDVRFPIGSIVHVVRDSKLRRKSKIKKDFFHGDINKAFKVETIYGTSSLVNLVYKLAMNETQINSTPRYRVAERFLTPAKRTKAFGSV